MLANSRPPFTWIINTTAKRAVIGLICRVMGIRRGYPRPEAGKHAPLDAYRYRDYVNLGFQRNDNRSIRFIIEQIASRPNLN